MLNCFFRVLLLANLLNCQLRATQLRSGVLTHALTPLTSLWPKWLTRVRDEKEEI